MVSNVLAAAAILRRHLRRVRSIGLLGIVTALGLIPLVLYMPQSASSQYALLSLVCLYAGRKVVQYFHARGALKQLSMEEHLLRYLSSNRRVRNCVENDDHMWARSRILDALKALATVRMPSNMLVDEKRRRIYRRYRKAFRKMAPRVAFADLGLLAAIAIAIVWTPTIGIDMRAMMFQAGFLALTLAILAEIWHLIVNRRLDAGLNRLYTSLSEWTVREVLEALSHPGPYSHRLHYFAQPWFAAGNDIERMPEGAAGSPVISAAGDRGP